MNEYDVIVVGGGVAGLIVGLRHADSAEGALAKVFSLGTPADVAGVWIDGEPIRG